MSAINLTNVVVLDNPTAYTNPFQFEVTFECLQQLEDGACAAWACLVRPSRLIAFVC